MGATGLLYVGAVLFLNGASLIGWVKGNSNAPMNVFVGLLQVVTPLYLIFTANGDPATILGASGLFLFGFTYLFVAFNGFMNLDGTGLGWFCIYVAAAAIVYAAFNYRDASSTAQGGYVFAVLWLQWAFLWFLFWLVLSMGRTSLTRYTGAVCLTQGIITGFIPALILLGQSSWFTTEFAIANAIVAIVLDVIYYAMVKTKPAPQASAAKSAY